MTSTKLVQANRRNALESTGPRSAGGKAASSRNALKHGTFSALPAIPSVERPEDWEAHRAGILTCLAPAGALEEQLADRVALALWRMNRVARFETAVIAAGQEEAVERLRDAEAAPLSFEESGARRLRKLEEDLADRRRRQADGEALRRLLEGLPGMPDGAPAAAGEVYALFDGVSHHLPEEAPDFEGSLPRALGVPGGEEPWEYAGWTAGMARRGLEILARSGRTTAERLLEKGIAANRQEIEERRADIDRLSGEAKALRRRMRAKEARARCRRAIPDDLTAQKIARYESHLSRQLYQALHELERLQARRAGQPVVPPLAVDVTVEAPEGAAPVTPVAQGGG
jgi:hypothetical protein